MSNPRRSNGSKLTGGHPAANANSWRRNQVRARVLAEETHCALCGQPVDKSLTYAWGQHGPRCKGGDCIGCVPHPMRPEVDEIIPRSQGGSPYERSNTQLTHRTCNRRKGDGRTSVPRPPAPLPTAVDW